MSYCKGMHNPETLYTSVVEVHNVEMQHASLASGHLSAGEGIAATGFLSGHTLAVNPIVRTEAAMEARPLMVADSGAAWLK